jgi:membrane protease YdiL (CAAX protease family)
MLLLVRWWLLPSGIMDGPTLAAREKMSDMGLDSRPIFLTLALFYSLCHSGLEEYYWRWFVFRHFASRATLATAVVVSSLGFMAHHILVLARYFGWGSPLTYGFSLCVAIGGIIWAVLYHRFGTLAGPWLGHALVDAAIFAIAYQMGDWN